jgi:cytochrome b pre-mRNA-processing protein 3
VVKKYLDEMGQQWKGASFALDYVMGLSTSDDHDLRAKADVELASWLWRNTFSTRGLPVLGGMADPDTLEGMASGRTSGKEVEMVDQLLTAVKFVRREMARLDELSDADVLSASVGAWGGVKAV